MCYNFAAPRFLFQLLPIYLIAGAGFMGAAAALIQVHSQRFLSHVIHFQLKLHICIQASDGRREVQDRINLNRGVLNSIAPQV